MSEIRQRQAKDRSPKRSQTTDSDSPQKSRGVEKSGGPNTCLVFLAILLLSLGSAFLYINHTHGETFSQTVERVQNLATKTIAQLQKPASDSPSAREPTKPAQKSSKGLARLEEEYGKSFAFSLENGVFSLTSRRCTLPIAIDDEWKGILAIAQKDFPEITDLLFDSYTCTFISNQGLIYAGEALSGFKNLKNLRVDLRTAKNITDDGVKQFGTLLAKNAPNLESLEFNLTTHIGKGQITDDAITNFATSIENLKNLRSLDLNLAGSKVTNEGVSFLAESVAKNHQKLTKFNLDLRWIRTFDDTFMTRYSQAISQLKNLESIYLNVDMCTNITDAGYTALGNALAQLSKLREFTISLYNSQTVTPVGYKALFNGLQTQPIERLGFHFTAAAGFDDVTNEAMQALLLKHVNTLQSLTLSFNSNKAFTNDGVKLMAATFDQTFPRLKEFVLDTTSAGITEESLLPLLNSLKKSGSTLETLAIKFDKIQGYADLIYIEFGELLQRYFQNLKQFDFYISYDPKITETIFAKFISAIGSISGLEALDILLAKAPKEFKEAMSTFANELQYNFRNLKSLSLQIYSPEFGADTVALFANGLQYQKQLDKFAFQIMNAKSFDNEAAKAIISGIASHLKNLTELQLTFNWADQISDETAKAISSLIPSNLRKLKKIKLNLSDITSITDKALLKMAMEFANHENLQVVFLSVPTRAKRSAALAPKMKAVLENTPAGDVLA